MAGRFLVTISRSVSFVGKAWCSSMLLLRLLLVSLAAFSLFGDEQERFVCNTIQPGCSSACFDVFAPVSVLRLWLLQLLLLSLPHLLFACYVLHRAAAASRPGSSLSRAALPLEPPSFHCSYLLLVLLRLLLELLFGAAQFFLFGLSVPKSFLCYEAPCTSGVQCYVSRPTEKSLMLGLMLAVASSSVLLSLLDLLGSLRAALGRRALLDQLSRGEQSSVFTSSATEDTDALPSRRTSPSGTSKSWTSKSGTTEHKPAAGLFLSQEKHPDGQHAKPPANPLAQLRPPLTPRPERDPITPGPKPDGSETRDKRAWV